MLFIFRLDAGRKGFGNKIKALKSAVIGALWKVLATEALKRTVIGALAQVVSNEFLNVQ